MICATACAAGILRRDRIAAMKQEAERRAALQRQGHGSYTEITEGEFLEVVTSTENVVCHFFHKDFERCKIVDKHMAALAARFLETRFIKLSAPVSWRDDSRGAAAEQRLHSPTASRHAGGGCTASLSPVE